MIRRFKLVGREVVACSLDDWGIWFGTSRADESSRVALDEVAGYSISTVFIGLSTSFRNDASDVFETAVFDASENVEIMDRYATWQEALDGHNACVALLRRHDEAAHRFTRAVLQDVKHQLRHKT